MLVDTCIVSQSVSEESRGHYGYDDQYIVEDRLETSSSFSPI
jgi:hypothetical protein